MKAIDTNVVVRIITQDDPAQTATAQAVVNGGVVISSGAWIETEWVLRSIYRMPRERITAGFHAVLLEEGVQTADGAVSLGRSSVTRPARTGQT